MPVAAATDDVLPSTQTELCRWMGDNAAKLGQPIYPVGGRTAIHYGPVPSQAGISLCTTNLTRVIDYPARDMTVTVESGIRFDELSKVLAKEGQRLPIDVPQLHRATLGGIVASNCSGSRRYGLGTLRDYVIGVSAADPAGKLFKAGGRVVKNVAGYDLCKMLVGSFGTLAVITQLTLKLRPVPEQSILLWIPFDDFEQIEAALAGLVNSSTRPVALDVLNSRAASAVAAEAGLDLPGGKPILCIGLEGSERETAWQIDTLKSELHAHRPRDFVSVTGEAAAKLWFALAEFQIPSDDPLTFVANLLPSQTIDFLRAADEVRCSVQAHAGNGIVVGHLPDSTTLVETAVDLLDDLRAMTRQTGGNLKIVQCDDRWKPMLPLQGEPEPAWGLMRKLKQQLDPRNLLNPHYVFGE